MPILASLLCSGCFGHKDIPDTFQMHWANLHYMLLLLAFENAVTPASSHARNIEELGTIDHMVIWSNERC